MLPSVHESLTCLSIFMVILMKLLSKVGFSVMASAIMLCMNTSAFAEGGRNHSNNGTPPPVITNLSASLTGTSGLTGTVWYTSSSAGGGRLQASIHLPVDGTTILDSNTAVSSQYALQLGSTGTVCTLIISDVDFTYATLGAAPVEVAEYKAAVSETGTTATASIGNCYTGSSATTVFPAITAGESVNVSLVAAGVTSPTLLTGTFTAPTGYPNH